MVKSVREKTSAGIMDCRHALVTADGDIVKACDLLRQQGLARLERRAERVATQGLIEAYIHHGEQLGVLVEVNCETDFAAHTDEFKQLAHNVALQVAATAPQFISPEEIPQGVNLNSEEACLLAQPFIKDEARTIQEIVAETAVKVGEKISIARFARFELGKRIENCF